MSEADSESDVGDDSGGNDLPDEPASEPSPMKGRGSSAPADVGAPVPKVTARRQTLMLCSTKMERWRRKRSLKPVAGRISSSSSQARRACNLGWLATRSLDSSHTPLPDG